ncbi:MAG TPA: translocation/assembly module TamB domain-containing protein [Terriglobales bacterium]|nr:translocation/assembly module TamB domain-containing protein [Terriglobales bacterium]
MNESVPKPRRRGRWLLRLVIFVLASGLLVGWYLSSEAFEARLRAQMVEGIEEAIGTRVEIGSFHWDLWNLGFEAREMVLHGREPKGEPALARIESLSVRLKVLSLFRPSFGVREIVVTRPVVRIITFPDGSLNVPMPGTSRPKGAGTPANLHALSVDRLDITGGELSWNERRIPLDLTVRGVTLSLAFARFDRRYDGDLSLGNIEFRYGGAPPLTSRTRVIFRIWPKAAEISSLRWDSKTSRLEATARVESFVEPDLRVNYSGALDLREFGPLVHRPALRSGRIEFSGEGSGPPRELTFSGRMRWADVSWQTPGVRLSGLAGGAQFTGSRERLAFSNVFAHAMGGNLTGSVAVENWTPWRADEKSAPRGVANLKLTGIRLAALAGAVSTESLPLARLKFAGSAAGTVKLAWRGALAAANWAFALDIVPPAAPQSEDWPLRGAIVGAYRSEARSLSLEHLHLATPASRLEAVGSLGSPGASMEVSLRLDRLAEARKVLDIFASSLPLHLEPEGRAAFDGRLSGALGSPRLQGRFTAAEFAVTRPTGAEGSPLTMHFDAFSADLDYSAAHLEIRNAELLHDAAHIAFDLATELRHGRLEPSAPLTSNVRIRDASLDRLQSLAGTSYPLRGVLDLEFSARGTWLDPRGEGRLEVREAELFGEPFRAFASGLRVRQGELELSELVMAQNGGRAAGTAAWRFADRSFRLDLDGSGFQLSRFRRLQRPQFSTGGQFAFRLQGRGTLAQPDLSADVRLTDLVLNGEEAGDLEAHAVTRAGTLHLRARSAFQQAELDADGQIGLRAGWPAQLAVRFARLDIDPLLRAVVPGRITGHSAMAGQLRIEGPLGDRKALSLDAEVSQLAAEIAGVRLENDGLIQFAVRNGTLEVRRFHIVGTGTDLSAQGRAELLGARRLDLRSQGRVNFRLLQSLDPNFQASGDATMDLTITGTAQQPNLFGKLRIADASLAFIDAPNALSEINGQMTFNQNRLQIESLTARTGGGTLDLGGSVAYSRGLFFDLTARGREIRLRHPPGISSVADADLRFVGSAAGSLLSGEVTVRRFTVSPKFDFAAYLVSRRAPMALPGPANLVEKLRFDVHITSTPSLEVQTSLARISGDVDLRLRGTAAAPAVLGRVDITEGRIVFSGTEYRINQGEITFSNPVRVEPVLDLDASARVRQYDISIGLHGPIDHLTTTYRSDPPLPTPDIIALLALGRTREETVMTRQTTDTFGQDEASALLGSALNATLSSRVQRLFGVSRIKIDPQVAGPENNPNARLTIEQQVSPHVTLTYITNLSQSSQQVIQGEFYLSRTVSLVAVRDQNGVVGFELRIRQRKK